MKKLVAIILATAMGLIMLAACGSAADKAYVEWADEHVDKMEQAGSAYARDATAAGSDHAAALAAADAYLVVLNAAKSSFDRIDYSGLGSANKSSYDVQKQNIEEGLAGISEGRNQLQAALDAQQQQSYGGDDDILEPDEPGEYYAVEEYDDDEYYDDGEDY